MKKILLVLTVILSTAACHKHMIPATPAVAIVLNTDDVVIRVNELQAVLIEACGPAVECRPNIGFTTIQFRSAIQGIIKLRNTLRSTADGWRATARTGWAETKTYLTNITNPVIVAALSVVDAMIGGL